MSSNSDQVDTNPNLEALDSVQPDVSLHEHSQNITSHSNSAAQQSVSSTSAPSTLVVNAGRNSEHYSDFIKRITPRVVFVGRPNPFRTSSSSNQVDDSQSLPRFMSQRLSMSIPSTTVQLEESGLDKFKKYIKLHTSNMDHNLGESASRSIVGQEDICGASSQKVSSSSLQKGIKKWSCRPPVVGQASSSSNDSGSLVSGSSENDGEDEGDQALSYRQHDDMLEPATDTDPEYFEEIGSRAEQSHILSTREDYISERPPEGSSDQSSLSIGLQQELQTEPLREQPSPSTSSVASVSVRPLEWDSGADVGYYQMYLTNNPDIEQRLSTIERMALARGSAALLTRSDPEGTTEHGNQPVSRNVSVKTVNAKSVFKDRLGMPVAESTPFSTTDVKNVTPHGYAGFAVISGSEDDLSPIAEPTSNFQLPQQVIDPSVSHPIDSPSGISVNDENQPYCPLFPELSNKTNVKESRDVMKTVHIESNTKNKSNHSSPKKDQPITSTYFQASLVNDRPNNPSNAHGYRSGLPYTGETVVYGGNTKAALRKQFSSSMEHLNSNKILNSLISNEQPNTLPRSHSHSNIIVEEIPESLNTFPKYLMPHSHNPTKSASSSSISTVVQKRKDSPKRISKLVQTSINHQSVGTQASGGEPIHEPNSANNHSSCTHLKSPHKERNGINRNESIYFRSTTSNNSSMVSQKFSDKRNRIFNGHKHDGVVCTGAHKKAVENNSIPFDRQSTSNVSEKQGTFSQLNYSQENRKDEVESYEDQKNEDCGTLDSVTSSAKTDNNMWRRESMGAEDRVNSFEYLPGHVYETVGRHDNASGGTSSISINRNASSQNEVITDAEKNWDTSASSTVMRDIEQGVNMLSDFVKNSQVNNTLLKKKLIKRVAEKLIKSDYPDECLLQIENSLSVNIPWTPALPQQRIDGIRNGRETRRSQTKDSLPEESSISNDRMSSRTSSECFRPKASFTKTNKTPKDVLDKCIGTEQSFASHNENKNRHDTTESSDLQTDPAGVGAKVKQTLRNACQGDMSHLDSKDNDRYAKPHRNQFRKTKHFVEHIEESADTLNTDKSSSVDCSGDWRAPVSKSEKLFEQRRKLKEDILQKDLKKGNTAALLEYLNVERENQLFWIKAEIDHLGNLKRLLEKQEELKKSLTRIRKSRKQRSILSVVNDRNEKTTEQRHTDQPKRLEKTRTSTSHKADENIIQDINNWDSHHYSSSVEESPRNLSKRLNEKNTKGAQLTKDNVQKARNMSIGSIAKHSIRNDARAINKESSTLSYDDEEESEDDDLHLRRTVGTETTDSVGVQTSKSVQQLPVIKPDWFKRLKKSKKTDKVMCPCLKKDCCRCMKDRSTNESKTPVAYFITFEEPSEQGNAETKRSLKEVKITIPEKPSNGHGGSKNYHHYGQDCRHSCSTNCQKENFEPKQTTKTKRGRPTLQDYLIMNRSDYVSRAEYRRKCVAELAYLRELRDKSKRHLIAMAPESSDYSQSSTPRDLPPPPLAVKRVFSQRTMRRQTERKYRQLAEVQNRHLDMKRKESYRTNRLMAEVFTKKLQKRTLKGEVNLSNSVSVISSI